MAAGTSAPTPPSPAPDAPLPRSGKFIEYDRYIESQLRKTRRQVKAIDLAASLMLLAAGSMFYLMLAALADQWLVAGGLGFGGRVACLSLFVAGVLVYVALRLGPLVVRRINPVYAAQAIEQSRPGLKNSLVNFLLLRSSRDALPQRIYEAIEEQAANGLSAARADTAVDRSPLVKFLTMLMVAVSALALYRIASPKNPFTSMRRVIEPWADIPAPTRVAIEEILPGDGDGYHDQHLSVTAQISGLSAGEHPTVHYSTADGQTINHPVRMTLPENGYRHRAELPAEPAGLQQDLEYWITAGDAISKRYKIAVLIAPAIVVDAVDYKYPAYSEQTARSVPRRGDIQALEGTQVTVRATATHEIQSADLDFDCDGQRDLAMKIDGRRASVSFPLVLKRGSDQPEHASYQLRFKNRQGHENPKPIRYAIEVVRDLPPEIAIVEPELKPTEETLLAAGGSLTLKLTASDPDFKLADVRLRVQRGNEPLLDEALLAEPRGGPFERRFVFATRSLKLKPGDMLTLWAAADDNKQPQANHVETPHYTLRIASPDGKQEQDQLASAETNKKSQDKPQNDRPNDKPNPAERRPGENDQADGKQPPEKDPNQDQPEKGGKQKKQKQDRRKPNEQQGGEEQSGEQQGGGQSDKNGQGKPSAGQKPMGDNQSGDDQSQSDDDQGDGRQNGKNGKGPRKSSDEQQGKDGGQEASERVDPDKDDGKAIDEINKFFNDKKQDQPPQDDPGKKQPDGKSSDPSKKSPAGGEQSPGKQDQQPPAGKRQPGEKPGESPSEQQPGERGSQEDGSQGKGSQEKKEQPGKGEKNSRQQPGTEGRQDRPMPNSEGSPSAKSQGEKPTPDKKQAGQQGKDQQGAGEKGTGKQEGERRPDGDQPGEKANEKQTGEQRAKDDAQQMSRGGEKKDGEKGKDGETSEAPAIEQKPENGKNPAGKNPQGENKPNDADQQPGPGQSGGKEGQGKQPSKEQQPPEGGGKAGKSNSKDKTPQQGGEAADGQDKSMKPGEEGKKQDGEAARVGDEAPQKDAQGDQKSQDGKAAGQTKGKGEPNDKQNPDAKDPNKDVAGGDPEGQDRGKGGAGKAGGNKDPVASPKGQNQQKDKQQKPDEGGRANTDEKGNSGSESDRQSDSKSDKSGDLSGGGGKGGGQRSQSPGKGSAGQNTDADQGGGQSEQTGQGPKSDKAGEQVKGEKPSGGASSGEKGPGSKRQSGGAKPGAGEEPSDESRPNRQPGDSDKEQAGGQPVPSAEGGHDLRQGKGQGNAPNHQGGGGVPGSEKSPPPPPVEDTSEPGGDDPNLEYTRKATDLALDRLKDQLKRGDPDQELLDKLKWSRQDVEEFVKRWDALKHSAQSPGAPGDAAREELDETLRSLGLRPRGSSLSGGQKRGDQRRNLIESRRTAPPAEYAEQYREFSKGISKAKK
jgi:hypothetical protein